MNSNGMAKMYDRLTPSERLPLVVAAAARGDAVEVNRLNRSAPTIDCRIPHHFHLHTTLHQLAMWHHMELLDSVAGFQLLLGHIAVREKQAVEPKGESNEAARALSWKDVRLTAYGLVTYLDGWRLFCSQLGIDGDVLLGGLPGQQTVKRVEQKARELASTAEEATTYLSHQFNQAAPAGVVWKAHAITPVIVAGQLRELLDGLLARSE